MSKGSKIDIVDIKSEIKKGNLEVVVSRREVVWESILTVLLRDTVSGEGVVIHEEVHSLKGG